jgi:hypothetical protein
MIEIVARAISGDDEVTQRHIASARRAIEAMQSASPTMRQVGGAFFDNDDASLNGRSAMAVYTAMIGAALAICAPAAESPDSIETAYSDQRSAPRMS